MKIEIVVNDEAEFKLGFFKENPVPEDWEGTEDEWIHEWLSDQAFQAYSRGKEVIARESVVPQITKDILV